MNNNDIDFCCLSEIFSHGAASHKLLNYNILKKTRSNDNYGGVAICYRKYIKMKKINHNFDSEVVIVRTLNLDNNFVICSVYFKPDMAVAEFIDSIYNIFDFLEIYENVIICGDFNARSKLWGDPTGNIKSLRLK